MIAVDWGTSSLRSFLLGAGGQILGRVERPAGIMHVDGGAFAETLTAAIGPWLETGERRVLMSGMIGSRQGWREAAYLPCPAGTAELARSLTPVPFSGAEVFIVPGLIARDGQGVPEVMRGEETQIAGALAAMGPDGIACLPGTHSKWAKVEGGRILSFTTHMTGEVFAVLRGHTILGRLMAGEAEDEEAFRMGVSRSADPGGLLHHLFGTRTLGLTGGLSEAASSSYLSGLLIGHELHNALAAFEGASAVHLIGSARLCRLYARALSACGRRATVEDQDAAVTGLTRIGELAPWT